MSFRFSCRTFQYVMRAVLACAISIFPMLCFAAKYSLKVTTGGLLSRERFVSPDFDGESNDVAVASGRVRFDLGDFSPYDLTFTTDVRDKHDFFDKLDRERMELSERNTAQVRELNLAYRSAGDGFEATGGRFSLAEAGPVFVDGGRAEAKLFSGFRLGAFGGLNPKQPDKSYLEFDSKSSMAGGYLSYQDTSLDLQRYLYSTAAIVQLAEAGHTDRLFWYQNFVARFGSGAWINSFWTLDFVPSTRLQSLLATWTQPWTPALRTSLSGLVYDTVEYQRRQGLLERLPASPYREGDGEVSYAFSQTVTGKIHGSYGKRESDSLERVEGYSGLMLSGFSNRHFALNLFGGYRDNFGWLESFGRIGGGYTSSEWELNTECEIAQSRKEREIDYPIVTSLSAAGMLFDSIYSNLSFQYARDAVVRKFSVLLAVSYRLSNREVASPRDVGGYRGPL